MSLQVCFCGWSKVTSYQGLRIHQGKNGCTPKGMRIPESEQFGFNTYKPHYTFLTPIKLEEPTMSIFRKSDILNEISFPTNEPYTWRSHHQTDNTPIIVNVEPAFRTQMSPPAKETREPSFETPQHFHQPATNSDKARRALDFSAITEQTFDLFNHNDGDLIQIQPPNYMQQMAASPRTASQETEKEKKKKMEAEELLKARQDRMKAKLEQKIKLREQQVAEVRESVKGCKVSLDAEWLEINSAFSEAIKVMEEARLMALKPLEERKFRVKREGQELVHKLEREIEKLKMSIDELDKNPDLQDDSQDCQVVNIDASLSFGTLRTTTSAMMEEIRLKLEKLSSVELTRIPAFAVDVKLDPSTAHPCLVLCDDGKKVSDGGKNQKVPDSHRRFDLFGSVLGINSLTSGKSYWEVEVGNKTGWDLGGARGDAKHKGELTLNPDNGFWVTVHYEDKRYAALTAPPLSLTLRQKPQKVGVFVDYDEGLVSFYDVTARAHIYSFTECSFGGELFPYFSPHLHQNGRNSDPLIISAVKKQ
uniref:B30.2/SPRY domain-containing protein n=2 Tax=Echeneis naucrates TaxID=173247 RepID=A0A665VHA5_ECHNA